MSGIKTVYLFMFVHLLIVEVIGIENGEKLLVPNRHSNCCGGKLLLQSQVQHSAKCEHCGDELLLRFGRF